MRPKLRPWSVLQDYSKKAIVSQAQSSPNTARTTAQSFTLYAMQSGETYEIFCSYDLGACRWRTPRTRADLGVPKDAFPRDISNATLRFDLACAVGMRRKSR